MTKLLLKLFVKDYENVKDAKVRADVGKLAGMTGIVCNCLLAGGKMFTGLAVGSISIVADAVNNISDAASSVVTLFGFRLAQRPADRDHPYGHARYEYLSGLVIAAMILLVGVELIKSSASKIVNPAPIEIMPAVIFVLIIFAAIKLWLCEFFKKLSKKIDAATLLAAAVDSRNDVISTCAVLLGCLVNYIFNLDVDGYVGFAVALFIIYSGVGIAKDTVSPLLGKQAEKGMVDKLSGIILSNDKVLGIHDLLVHDYGPGQCYASVHVELSAEENLLVCHDIIDDIEWDVLNKMNVHLVIHYDPVVKNDEEQNEMRKTVEKIVRDINPEFTVHDFRIARGARQPKLVFDLSVPYSQLNAHGEIKRQIDEHIISAGKEYITIIRFDGKA